MTYTVHPDKRILLDGIRELFSGNDGNTQCKRVLEVLQRGYPLNTFEASRYLDVYHCPARILQLRAEGHNIVTHRIKVFTEAGKPHTVGNYMLVRGVQHGA